MASLIATFVCRPFCTYLKSVRPAGPSHGEEIFQTTPVGDGRLCWGIGAERGRGRDKGEYWKKEEEKGERRKEEKKMRQEKRRERKKRRERRRERKEEEKGYNVPDWET